NAMMRMSGSAMTNAMLDLRRANAFTLGPRPMAATGRSRTTASFIDLTPRSPAHEAFELGGGPCNGPVDRFAALRDLRDHLGVRGLGVHLHRKRGRRRRLGAPRGPVATRRVGVRRSFGRPFLGPDLEFAQPGEAGNVVAAARGHQLLDHRAMRKVGEQALARRFVVRELPDAPEE